MAEGTRVVITKARGVGFLARTQLSRLRTALADRELDRRGHRVERLSAAASGVHIPRMGGGQVLNFR